jgi:periplasmic divalent cation tolerance protein
MKASGKFVLVLVTAPNLKIGRRLAREALRARLIACANLIPKIESHYRWQGKIESSPEVLLLLKTTRPRLAALEKLILAHHPYDTPEFLVVNLSHGNARYLRWLSDSVS